MFCPVRKDGQIGTAKPLSGEGLARILRRREGAAGLAEPLTWHDLRRTFAGNMFASGADGVVVQKLMGHSSLTTTGNYDRRGEEARRKAAQQLRLPL